MKPSKHKVRFTKIPLKNVVKEGVLWTERDLVLDIIKDGYENDFPKWWTDIVYGSPTASACVDRIIEFIAGKSLHEDIKDIIVNKETGETFQELHDSITKDYGLIDRFGIKITPSRGGKIAILESVPMEWIRYKDYDNEEGNITEAKINPYISKTQQAWFNEQTQTLPLFEGGVITKESLLFFNETSPRNRIYSRPSFISVKSAMITEARMWEFHDRNTQNNFFLGGLLYMTGDPDQRITYIDENGNEVNTTSGKVVENQLANTLGGTENAGRIAVFWSNDINAPHPKFEGLPSNKSDEMFTRLYADIILAITTAIGVPQVLLPIAQSGVLGENQQIRNAIKFLNARTEKKRKSLESIYRKILPSLGVNIPEDEPIIIPIADITDLPDSIFMNLSPNQKETYLNENFGINPDEENQEERQEQTEEQVNREIEQLIQENALNSGNNN